MNTSKSMSNPSMLAAMAAVMGSPLNNNARGYHSASTGTNRSKHMRTVYRSNGDKDIPKGHELFYFTEAGDCFSRIDLANTPKEDRPEFIHQIVAKTRNKAIKQFKSDIAAANETDDIKPGDECKTEEPGQIGKTDWPANTVPLNCNQ